ncbi:MAG: c-type cytochrome [Hyphomicrobiales bacterium]|nr:c-type cytochrome [Hyphomicrobiales bacterium]
MSRIVVLIAALLMAACGGEKTASDSKSAASASEKVSNGETATSAAAEKVAEAAPEPIDPERAYRPCAVCHSVADPNTPKGKIQLAGPNLFGIYGAKAAQQEGFAYSQAMRDAGITWNDENLDAYIERPSTFIRGNRMAYVGERNPDKRAAIIEYLKAQK